MKPIIFYFHAGSSNHGCEAIVRTTTQLLNACPCLISFDAVSDLNYNLEDIVDVEQFKGSSLNIYEKICIKIHHLLTKNERLDYFIRAKNEVKQFQKGAIAFSIGGDNYCYGDAYNYHLAGLNYYLHKKGFKTVLWACSIEPQRIDKKMIRDFKKYDLIVARESISYETLKRFNENTVLACDPAFLLNSSFVQLPDIFAETKVVGINVSPLIIKKNPIILDCFEELMNYVLSTSDYSIALIPHVVEESNNDYACLREVYKSFERNERVSLIEDMNCSHLKYVIGHCSLFIGARTHSTIAAYSSLVPTIVVGYSNKSKGIAKDLFGTYDQYVIDADSIISSNQLIESFEWLKQNEMYIRSHLEGLMPHYCKTIDEAKIMINSL